MKEKILRKPMDFQTGTWEGYKQLIEEVRCKSIWIIVKLHLPKQIFGMWFPFFQELLFLQVIPWPSLSFTPFYFCPVEKEVEESKDERLLLGTFI